MSSCSSSGIAIVGLACRFPGAKTPSDFWKNLRDGVEAVEFLTADQLRDVGLDPRLLQHPKYVNACIRLEEIDLFDASFFGFSPREAELLDPQQRLFLECAWEAFEDAGWVPESFPGLAGVFAGVNASHYAFNLFAEPEVVRTMGMFAISLGTDKDHLSTRVAYKLNLKGPAITVQTTCSTSLVAICQACQSLLNYQCDLALAGGSSILLNQNGYFYEEEGIPSPDGHCRAFDAMAKGTIGGSGVGSVLLKRLHEALNDGDPIHAVIRGFAVNNDGGVKVGYTAPSIDGQAEVISMALRMGEIDPETISYVEAHGTGTPLGDPIEVAALTKSFRESGAKRNQYCGIGSVKSNIGHCDPAAGVAGLIKTVLALKHRMLPPTLHFEQPNPNIDFQHSPFYVNHQLNEWKPNGALRRGAVSSFGIGGTNAHVIVEEAPELLYSHHGRPWQLLTLSAKSAAAVDTAVCNLGAWLRDHPDSNLADVAFTLQVGRKHFPHRRVLVCPNGKVDEASMRLEKLGKTGMMSHSTSTAMPRVGFMFSGQGSQHINMGLGLYRSEKTFRQSIDECAELLQPHLKTDLRTVIYPTASSAESAEATLQQTAWTQPALFALEYALARLWNEWGVDPYFMTGHSIGEYVAACLAGVFTLGDGLTLVATRGRLMQSVPAGAMLTVLLSEGELLQLLPAGLSLAAVNAPAICTVAGPLAAIERFERLLSAKGIGARRLRTSHAFHSQMIEPMLEPFAEELRRVRLHPPTKPFLSNLSGTWITSLQATDPNYWVQHARQTVRFASSIEELLKDPRTVLIEIGPGRALQKLALQTNGEAPGRLICASLPHPQERSSDLECALETLGYLWVAGHPVNWPGFHAHERRARVSLPTYPFERQRFWIEPPQPANSPSAASSGPETRRDIADWFYQPEWEEATISGSDVQAELAARPLKWLIFCDDVGLGQRIAALLRKERQDVVTIKSANSFTQTGRRAYGLRPKLAEDYNSLFVRLREEQLFPDRILHLFCVQRDDEADNDLESVKAFGFFSLLGLAQAIAEERITSPIQLGVAATQLFAVRRGEQVVAAKAMVQGPCRVIPQEFPSLRCRTIDLGFETDRPESIEAVAHWLIHEMLIPRPEGVVAYRAGTRWTQRFRKRPIGQTWGPAARLRRRGVYLITGGLGQIGLEIADYLGRSVQGRLILLGRSDFPKREMWESCLAAGRHEPTCRKIRRLIELESIGAEILVMRADVADSRQMAAVFAEAQARFGLLNGIVHAAGLTGEAAAAAFTDANEVFCEGNFRAKIDGLMVIDRLLKGQSLDFVVLMSSLSALLGGLGFIAYASANAFLDAYATARNRCQFVPWISINWDGWNFAVADPGDYLRPSEGVEVFARIMHRLPERTAVSIKPFSARVKQWVELESIEEQPASRTESSIEPHPRPEMTLPYEAPRNVTEKGIVEAWETLLGIQPIGIRDNYFELGGDSLLAIQVTGRLRKLFQVKLAVQTLFEAPTAAELAERILQEQQPLASEQATMSELINRIQELSEEEVKALLQADDEKVLQHITDQRPNQNNGGNGSAP